MIKLMEDVCVCQRLPEETKKKSLFGVFKFLTWSKSWSLSLFSAASLAPRSRVVCWHCIILACNSLPISIKCHTYLMSDRLNHFNLTKSAFTSSMARWVSVIFFSFPSFSPWWDLQKEKELLCMLLSLLFFIEHQKPLSNLAAASLSIIAPCIFTAPSKSFTSIPKFSTWKQSLNIFVVVFHFLKKRSLHLAVKLLHLIPQVVTGPLQSFPILWRNHRQYRRN